MFETKDAIFQNRVRDDVLWGSCSSVGRAGRLVIERLLVQIPAQGCAACQSVLEQDIEPHIAHQ